MAKSRSQVITKVPLGYDLEAHVKIDAFGGETFFSIRQYIPSLKKYGRGITLPISTLSAVEGGLNKVGIVVGDT